MHFRVPEAGNSIQVIAGGVSLVAIETIARIARVEFEHDPVASDLGDNRGGRDRRAACVAVDDRTLRHHEIGHPKRIDQHEIGKRHQAEDGPLHCPQGRLMNIDRVDLGRIRGGHCPARRPARDLLIQPRAFERGHGFRVADSGNVSLWIEHDGGRDDGTREAAAANLVDAGDQVEPQPPDRVFERPESADFDHGSVARRLHRLLLGRVFHARGLSLQLAQEIELRATDARSAHDVDLVDDRRVQRKNSLDALAE